MFMLLTELLKTDCRRHNDENPAVLNVDGTTNAIGTSVPNLDPNVGQS